MLMTPTVFFSWQSDLPGDKNTSLIRSCLKSALKGVEIEEPLRPDEAASGESGTPDISEIIFRKLTICSAAVFDVTPVTKTENGKLVFNPNVAIELGFAVHALGWDRIVLVYNREYGNVEGGVPFHLRHRRFPIVYDSRKDLEKQTPHLTSKLGEYVKMAIDSPHREADRIRRRFTDGCSALVGAYGNSGCFHYEHSSLRPDIERLLDLGVIEIDVNLGKGLYAYHWTRFGSIICAWYQKAIAADPDFQALHSKLTKQIADELASSADT